MHKATEFGNDIEERYKAKADIVKGQLIYYQQPGDDAAEDQRQFIAKLKDHLQECVQDVKAFSEEIAARDVDITVWNGNAQNGVPLQRLPRESSQLPERDDEVRVK